MVKNAKTIFSGERIVFSTVVLGQADIHRQKNGFWYPQHRYCPEVSSIFFLVLQLSTFYVLGKGRGGSMGREIPPVLGDGCWVTVTMSG